MGRLNENVKLSEVPGIVLGLVLCAGLIYAFEAWPWFSNEATASTGPSMSVDASSVSQENRPIVREAATVLFDRCPRLVQYRSDIERITAHARRVPDGIQWRGQPWRSYVYIEVVIADDPETVPDRLRAWGHHLHYFMGGGTHPGIDTGKSQAHAMCSDNPQSGAFIPDDRLKVVGRLHF